MSVMTCPITPWHFRWPRQMQEPCACSSSGVQVIVVKRSLAGDSTRPAYRSLRPSIVGTRCLLSVWIYTTHVEDKHSPRPPPPVLPVAELTPAPRCLAPQRQPSRSLTPWSFFYLVRLPPSVHPAISFWPSSRTWTSGVGIRA